jgi:hypothetical protein
MTTRALPGVGECLDPSFWRSICPQLHIEKKRKKETPFALPPLEIKDLKQRLAHDGYFKRAPSEELDWSVSISDLALGVEQLVECGLPASFIFIFDEPWVLMHQASQLLTTVSGGNRIVGDVLAWHVDPNKGNTGFSPHRDRQPTDVPSSFRSGGEKEAKYLTCWVPLTDATPENSCLYVIPAFCDPGYHGGDRDDTDPMQVALSSPEAYQNIRCLSEKAGGAVCFTHRIFHWGSKGRERKLENHGDTKVGPRIALSFAYAEDQFEPPYLPAENFPRPRFELRVALMAAQVINYRDGFADSVTDNQLKLFYKLFNKSKRHFSRAYQNRIVTEFTNAYYLFDDDGSEDGLLEGDDNEDDLFHNEDGDLLDDDDDDGQGGLSEDDEYERLFGEFERAEEQQASSKGEGLGQQNKRQKQNMEPTSASKAAAATGARVHVKIKVRGGRSKRQAK